MGKIPLHSKRGSALKVASAYAVRFKQHVDIGCEYDRDQKKIIAVERIGKHYIARGKGVTERTRQSRLATAFSGTRANCCLDHGTFAGHVTPTTRASENPTPSVWLLGCR